MLLKSRRLLSNANTNAIIKQHRITTNNVNTYINTNMNKSILVTMRYNSNKSNEPTTNNSNNNTTTNTNSNVNVNDLKIHHVLTKLGKYTIASVNEDITINNAISYISSNAIPAMLVTEPTTNAATGIYTSSDILRYLDKYGFDRIEDTIHHKIAKVITPLHKLVSNISNIYVLL